MEQPDRSAGVPGEQVHQEAPGAPAAQAAVEPGEDVEEEPERQPSEAWAAEKAVSKSSKYVLIECVGGPLDGKQLPLLWTGHPPPGIVFPLVGRHRLSRVVDAPTSDGSPTVDRMIYEPEPGKQEFDIVMVSDTLVERAQTGREEFLSVLMRGKRPFYFRQV